LAAGVAKGGICSRLPLEFVDQGGFAYARLSRDEYDLPLPGRRSPKVIPQLAERAVPSHKSVLPRSCGIVRRPRGVYRDGSDKLVSAPWQSLNKTGIPRVVAQRSPNIEDVALQNVGLNMRIGPDGIEYFLLRHQPARVFYQIS
jgi:hypothetical protein